jgi:phosphohistidine phosphatase
MADVIQLYLVRHALAAERGEQYSDDAIRPLTEKGIARFRAAVKGLIALDVEIQLVLTSPLVRARQTANLLTELLPSRPPVVETPALAPGASFRAFVDAVSGHARNNRLALVGHEPGLGEVAGRLIGTRTPLPFRKGGVCRIDVDALPPAGPGHLVWFATPRMLRKLR